MEGYGKKSKYTNLSTVKIKKKHTIFSEYWLCQTCVLVYEDAKGKIGCS